MDFERGSSQYLSIADASQAGLDLSGDATFEAYIRPESLPTAESDYWSIIAKEDDSNISKRAYFFYLHYKTGSSSVTLECLISNGTGYELRYVPVTLNLNTWHHVAVSIDISEASPSKMTFYLDGVDIGHGTQEIGNGISSIQNTATPFTVGARLNNGTAKDFFDGVLDEVRVWNDVRTPSEVDTYMDTELTGTESNLMAYYPFEVIPSPSLSPSASVSPSSSTSPSVSPSASISPSSSVSASTSPSSSTSPSASISPSSSESASTSPSGSTSPSLSPSASPSPSPAEYEDLYTLKNTSYNNKYANAGNLWCDNHFPLQNTTYSDEF